MQVFCSRKPFEGPFLEFDDVWFFVSLKPETPALVVYPFHKDGKAWAQFVHGPMEEVEAMALFEAALLEFKESARIIRVLEELI